MDRSVDGGTNQPRWHDRRRPRIGGQRRRQGGGRGEASTQESIAKAGAPPGQSAANKEMGMANADMSMGKSKSACMHYMKAQKAAMMK